jgi:hypothetical protein
MCLYASEKGMLLPPASQSVSWWSGLDALGWKLGAGGGGGDIGKSN